MRLWRWVRPGGACSSGFCLVLSGADPRCGGTSFWVGCVGMLWLLLTFLAELLGAVAFPFTLVRFRGQKNARPRVHLFTVLLGTAGAAGLGTSTGSVLALVLLRSRTGFVLVWCLCYCNGGPMARPWFKFFGSTRDENFGMPSGMQVIILAQRQTRRYIRT